MTSDDIGVEGEIAWIGREGAGVEFEIEGDVGAAIVTLVNFDCDGIFSGDEEGCCGGERVVKIFVINVVVGELVEFGDTGHIWGAEGFGAVEIDDGTVIILQFKVEAGEGCWIRDVEGCPKVSGGVFLGAASGNGVDKVDFGFLVVAVSKLCRTALPTCGNGVIES